MYEISKNYIDGLIDAETASKKTDKLIAIYNLMDCEDFKKIYEKYGLHKMTAEESIFFNKLGNLYYSVKR